MRRASRPNLFGHDRADRSTFFVEKRNAELKSPAKIKSEKLSTLEKPVAVAQWIAQVSQLRGFDIARFLFIFRLNYTRFKLAQIQTKNVNPSTAKDEKCKITPESVQVLHSGLRSSENWGFRSIHRQMFRYWSFHNPLNPQQKPKHRQFLRICESQFLANQLTFNKIQNSKFRIRILGLGIIKDGFAT